MKTFLFIACWIAVFLYVSNEDYKDAVKFEQISHQQHEVLTK